MNQLFSARRFFVRRLLWMVATFLSAQGHGENEPNVPDDDRVRHLLVGFWIGSECEQETAFRDHATFTDDGRCMGRWENGHRYATDTYYSGTFWVQDGVVEVSLVSAGRKPNMAERVRFRIEILSDDAFRRTDDVSGRVLNYQRRPKEGAQPKLSPAIPVPAVPEADSSVRPRLGG